MLNLLCSNLKKEIIVQYDMCTHSIIKLIHTTNLCLFLKKKKKIQKQRHNCIRDAMIYLNQQ